MRFIRVKQSARSTWWISLEGKTFLQKTPRSEQNLQICMVVVFFIQVSWLLLKNCASEDFTAWMLFVVLSQKNECNEGTVFEQPEMKMK